VTGLAPDATADETATDLAAAPERAERVDATGAESQPRVRFAAQRIAAAQRDRLPVRRLLTRARSEGEAHRRYRTTDEG